jgi:subtilisin family serine protease
MDFKKYLLYCPLTFLLFISISCTQEKTKESVFPENSISNEKASACEPYKIKSQFIVQWEDGHFSLEKAENAEIFKNTFITQNLKNIKFVEYDQKIIIPQLQFSNNPSRIPENWGTEITQSSEAWDQGFEGQGIAVGVVDSGVDTNHNQINSAFLINDKEIPNNGLDDDQNGYVDDIYGYDFNAKSGDLKAITDHGTHVAGIILGRKSELTGSFIGVAPKAQLIGANFMGTDGGGSLGAAIQAIEYMATRGVRVINASWGGAPCVESLKLVIQNIESQGVLFVAASGNSGVDLDAYPEYPAAYQLNNQITVAASTITDRTAGFSNTSFNLVHLVAPGAYIYSTLPNQSAGTMSGTSMAAPFVSGAAAVLFSVRPQATPQQVKQALLKSVDLGPYKVISQGRLNLGKAVLELKKMVP